MYLYIISIHSLKEIDYCHNIFSSFDNWTFEHSEIENVCWDCRITLTVLNMCLQSKIGMTMCPGRNKGVWRRDLTIDLAVLKEYFRFPSPPSLIFVYLLCCMLTLVLCCDENPKNCNAFGYLKMRFCFHHYPPCVFFHRLCVDVLVTLVKQTELQAMGITHLTQRYTIDVSQIKTNLYFVFVCHWGVKKIHSILDMKNQLTNYYNTL
jgi:hypothetical protein